MKRLTTTFALIFSLMLFASAGFAQQTDTEMAEKKQHMMEMMQDSTMRAMMMEYIAENPEMRKQMMQQMQQKMMDNPEMKERMQKHMKMMQAMMEGKEMDHSKMKQMMGDSSMMKMHMMCMQMMMQDGMMDKDGMKSGKDNHEQHHN